MMLHLRPEEFFYFLEDPVMRFQFAKWLADDKVTVPIQGWNVIFFLVSLTLERSDSSGL